MNVALLQFVNGLAGVPWMAKPVAFFAEGFGYLLLGALLYFLFTHDDKERSVREIILMLAVALASWVMAHVVKYLFYVPRPFVEFPDIVQLIPHDDDSSFPSGHAAFYSALATAMYFYHRKIALVLALGALIVGIARVAAGVHYPIDIVAGFALGIAIAGAAYYLLGRTKEKAVNDRF